VVADSFAQDLPARTTAVMAATQRPLALSAGLQPSGAPAYQSIPSWWLLGLQDKVIPAAQQRFMAQRAHSQITEIDASHVSLISHPDAVEQLVNAVIVGVLIAAGGPRRSWIFGWPRRRRCRVR
jgi:pimeloyl-ACP methyl ester carboxylesterase